jgi:uncharacterized GH25 family protein
MLCTGLAAGTCDAHYNMLLPEKASARKTEAVRFTYQWGHPFEHQLFDAPKPHRIRVRAPDGKVSDLTESLREISVPGADGTKVTAYQFQFIPAERGDYVFLLETPPIWMEEEGEWWQDVVKAVLHVQAQKGWEQTVREFEFQPMTRPYGLLPGMVFLAQISQQAKGVGGVAPLAGSLVEVERYNAAAPKELPPDELITRAVRTDLRGVVTTTLTDPGWWALTTTRMAGTREHKGKEQPLRQRSTLWVFVEDRAGSR